MELSVTLIGILKLLCTVFVVFNKEAEIPVVDEDKYNISSD